VTAAAALERRGNWLQAYALPPQTPVGSCTCAHRWGCKRITASLCVICKARAAPQARRRRRDAAAKALEAAWERLQLLAAGVGPAAAGDEAAEAALARHLVRGEGEAAADALLRYQQARIPHQCNMHGMCECQVNPYAL